MAEDTMKISIKNFGPIAEAQDVALRPLTVFVGPSNTGKSYLAVLIYALFSSFEPGGLLFFRNIKRRETPSPFEHEKEFTEAFTKFIEKKEEISNFGELSGKLQALTKAKIGHELAQVFHEELYRCMGTSTKENQLFTDTFFLDFEDSQKSFKLFSFKKADLEIKNVSLPFRSYLYFRNNEPPEIRKQLFLASVLGEMTDDPLSLYLDFQKGAFYLPAARTGIMQSHQAIVGALLKQTPFAGLADVSVPTLSGILADFLQELTSMGTKQKEEEAIVSEIANEVEEKILKGSIKTRFFEAIHYPRFFYKQKRLEIPLLCSSSMVSELAPVVLFIRHRVRKGDLLIIEEPEAHLHPEAQRKIAAVIVRLVRAGVRVMVTTHSDYFLDQLANHVRLSKLKKSMRSQLPDPQKVFLEEDEIGAYVFNRRNGGTIVKQLKFDPENGLSPEDHDKVSSDLYNETVGLLEQFDQQNNAG